MSTAPPTTTTTATTTPAPAPEQKPRPDLYLLEEDDEFEEFASEDWEDKETYGASLAAKAGAGADAKKAATGLNSLWDDNWDDDDVADDFSVQLRGELAKHDQMQS